MRVHASRSCLSCASSPPGEAQEPASGNQHAFSEEPVHVTREERDILTVFAELVRHHSSRYCRAGRVFNRRTGIAAGFRPSRTQMEEAPRKEARDHAEKKSRRT